MKIRSTIFALLLAGVLLIGLLFFLFATINTKPIVSENKVNEEVYRNIIITPITKPNTANVKVVDMYANTDNNQQYICRCIEFKTMNGVNYTCFVPKQ